MAFVKERQCASCQQYRAVDLFRQDGKIKRCIYCIKKRYKAHLERKNNV